MKAVVYHGAGKPLALETLPDPEPGPDDVIVKVHRCGICGTDLHFRNMGTRFGRPMPLGHEFAGEVVAVGGNVRSFKVGDRVVTSGGLYGSITKLGEKSIQLQIADKVRVDVSKAAIVGFQGQDPVVPEGTPS